MSNLKSNRNAIDGVKGLPGGKGADKKGGVGSALPNNIKADSGLDKTTPGMAALAANDSFNKHYNKELKVSEGKFSRPC